MARREMTSVIRLLCIALLLVGGASFGEAAHAQTADDAFRFTQRAPATGARMTGLAGAGTAGFADYGMLFTNPAGLGHFGSSQAAGALNLVRAGDDALYQLPGPSSTTQDQTVSDYGGNFALVYKFPTARGSLVFGAGFNQVNTFERQLNFQGVNTANSITTSFLPFDNEFEVDEDGVFFPDDVPSNILPFVAFQAGAIEFFQGDFDEGRYPFEQAVLPDTPIQQSGRVTEEGSMNEASFGGAVEAAQGVMLGLSVNVAFGTYRFDNFFEEVDEGQNADYVVIRNGVEYVGLDAVQYEARFESDLVGGNLRGGLSAQMAPGLRGGLTVETPTFYRVRETYTTAAITTFFNDGGVLSYGNQPGDVGRGEFEYDIRTPWRLGAGLAFNPAHLTGGQADLTLSADVEFVDWTQLELDADGSPFEQVNQTIRDSYDAVLNTRVGAELGVSGVILRGGFAYRPDPRDEDDLGGVDRSKTFFSAGLGYRFDERLQLDLAWTQERFDDQYVPYTDPAVETPPIVEEEVRRSRFLIGLTYSF